MWESSTDSRTPRIRLRPSLQVPSPSWQLQITFRPCLHIHRSRRELPYLRQLAFRPPLRTAAAYHGKPSHMIQHPHTYFFDFGVYRDLRERRFCWARIRCFRSTFTVSPTSFPIARRISTFTGSMCLPSPIAINELLKGRPSIVPLTLTKPRVPKNLTEFGQTT